MTYNSGGENDHTWAWSESKFSCAGVYCGVIDLLVEAEGEDTDHPDKPECKFGNFVKLELSSQFSQLTMTEIAVIAAGQ